MGGTGGYWQGLELRTGTVTPFSCSVQKMEKKRKVERLKVRPAGHWDTAGKPLLQLWGRPWGVGETLG